MPVYSHETSTFRTKSFLAMRRYFPLLLIVVMVTAAPVTGQHHDSPGANFDLAARWAPYRINDMIYSTSVRPQWIEGTENFWYEWKSSEGTFYYIVDSNRGSKRQIFDNDRIAAELTRITRDPYDGQHLPIKKIKFIDANTLQFEVQGSQDEEKEEEVGEDQEEDEEEEDDKESKKSEPKKKVFHFEYDVRSRTLRELEEWEEPDNHPSWAALSPDGQTILFGRNYNIYKMSPEDYDKILEARRGNTGDDAEEAEDEIEVEETQLTTDGVEHFSYTGSSRGQTTEEVEENACRYRGHTIPGAFRPVEPINER